MTLYVRDTNMSEKRIARLRELAQAVTYGREAINREFTMRVPADEDRDADCVLTWAADALEQVQAENERLNVQLGVSMASGCKVTDGLEKSFYLLRRWRKLYADVGCPDHPDGKLFSETGQFLRPRQSAGDSEPGSTKQRLDMLDQFEEAERIAEHVSNLTKTDGERNDG